MTLLIVMRLANMTRVHPDQITATCSVCGHVVAIYPSGQNVMKQYPDIELVCDVCKPLDSGEDILAPGAELEPSQSVRKQ